MGIWRALTGRALVASDEAAISVASSPEASIPREEPEPEVSAMSPARLLAKSLTDSETRDEWVRTSKNSYGSFATEYHNDKRDLTVTRGYSSGFGMCGGHDWLYAPFTLSKAEKKIVREATETFDRHLQNEREKAALARLIAPRQRSKPEAETPKSGSVRSTRARSRKAGDAQ